MSLFTLAQDRRLPLITQVMQIDANNEGEIREFVWWQKYDGDILMVIDGEEVWLPVTQRIVAAVQGMITSAFFHGDVRSDLLNDLISTWRDVKRADGGATVTAQISRNVEGHTFFRLDGLDAQFPPPFPIIVLNEEIADEAIPILLQNQIDLLRLCPECSSIYLVQKNHPDQTYCSHRCRSRVGERRRRRERNTAKKVDVSFTQML